MEDWQKVWRFDFELAYRAGTAPQDAAEQTDRYWWHEQNRAIGQDCNNEPNCWLARGHAGHVSRMRNRSSPTGKYKQGEHVKIEVVNEPSGESEWMWLLVDHSDDQRQLVFGKLDQQPVVNTDMRLGQELAVTYDKIRDHRKFE
jgi:uncharacterized protein YegJ (DUF2314 family)